MALRANILKKAPLAEVVFELRWDTGVRDNVPLMAIDPGFPVLRSNFAAWAARAGYAEVEVIAQEGQIVMPHSVAARFRQSKEKTFPLWQVGPGLYAANDSSSYEWTSFKKASLKGLKGILQTYPEIVTFPLKPISLELRYWDIFDGEILGGMDLVGFVNQGLDIGLTLPKFFQDRKLFGPLGGGQLRYSFPVQGQKNTVFAIELASVKRGDARMVRLESKVVSRPPTLPSARDSLAAGVERWLEMAHKIASPFFKSVVKPHLMAKFK